MLMRSQVVVGGKSDGADEASVVADAPAGQSGLSVADLDGVDEVMQMLQGIDDFLCVGEG